MLFHVTADTRWSDLPLSGTFVEMLKRIVSLSGSIAAGDTAASGSRAPREVVPPTRILDGFGVFGPPPGTARPVPVGFGGRATFDHPPGFYGPPEGLLAVNTLAPADRLAPLDLSALSARREAYRMSEPQDLRGPILIAALALLALDALIVFLMAGGLRRFSRPGRPAAAAVVLAILAAGLMASPRGLRAGLEGTAGAEVDARDPARLCDHRRRRGRPHQQGRPAGPDAVPGAAHRARSRRADRDRSGARRAGVLSADLLADRAERAEALARGAGVHRRLHEARRHGAVRHPRRGRGAARTGRRDPRARHDGAALDPRRRSTFPSSSRCRATMC